MIDGKSLETIRDELRSDDIESRRDALKSLFESKPNDWGEYEPLVDELILLLENDPYLREGAAIALGRIASLDSDQRSRVAALLNHEDDAISYRAVDVFYRVSQRSPETVTPVVPSIVEFLAVRDGLEGETPEVSRERGEVDDRESSQVRHSRTKRRAQAVELLGQVVHNDPDALIPVIDDLAAIAGQDDYARIRIEVLGILAAVAEDHPEEFGGTIDPVAAVLGDAENADLRSNAAFLLAMIAEAHRTAVTDAVVDHRETLFEMLESEHDVAQNGAIGLLSYVAEERPETVEPAKGTVVDLLEHDLESVRGNAIWTLTYVGGEDVDLLERLERIAEADPSEEIRQHAAETIDELTAD